MNDLADAFIEAVTSNEDGSKWSRIGQLTEVLVKAVRDIEHGVHNEEAE